MIQFFMKKFNLQNFLGFLLRSVICFFVRFSDEILYLLVVLVDWVKEES